MSYELAREILTALPNQEDLERFVIVVTIRGSKVYYRLDENNKVVWADDISTASHFARLDSARQVKDLLETSTTLEVLEPSIMSLVPVSEFNKLFTPTYKIGKIRITLIEVIGS